MWRDEFAVERSGDDTEEVALGVSQDNEVGVLGIAAASGDVAGEGERPDAAEPYFARLRKIDAAAAAKWVAQD